MRSIESVSKVSKKKEEKKKEKGAHHVVDRALSSRPCSSETTEDSFYKYNGLLSFFVFFVWRDPLLVLGDPFDLGHYWSQPPKRSKAKKKGAPTKRHFFHFFHIFPNRSANLPSSSSGQDRRRHVRRGKLSLAVAPVRDAMKEEEEGVFSRMETT